MAALVVAALALSVGVLITLGYQALTHPQPQNAGHSRIAPPGTARH